MQVKHGTLAETHSPHREACWWQRHAVRMILGCRPWKVCDREFVAGLKQRSHAMEQSHGLLAKKNRGRKKGASTNRVKAIIAAGGASTK